MLTRGFTLIEVLVTLVILMFGLLGIAGLMARGQKASFEAYQRQAALAVANDMVERIRLNPAQIAVYAAGAALGTPAGGGTQYSNLLSGALSPNCGAAACTAAQLAAYDVALWDGLLQGYGERQTGGALVGGIVAAAGCIETVAPAACPAAPAPVGTVRNWNTLVSVAWQGNEVTVAPTTSTCGNDGRYGVDTQRRVVSLSVLWVQLCP